MILLLFDAGVAREALGRLVEEFRGHGEVGLGAGEADVAEVGRQQRQTGLDVGAFAVPGDQPVDGEGVAVIPNSE